MRLVEWRNIENPRSNNRESIPEQVNGNDDAWSKFSYFCAGTLVVELLNSPLLVFRLCVIGFDRRRFPQTATVVVDHVGLCNRSVVGSRYFEEISRMRNAEDLRWS